MYFGEKQTQSLVEIEFDPPKTGPTLPKSTKKFNNLSQQFRFAFGKPKPLFTI